jgi:poly-gamma-glutamate synthesis protein (capsule biosynthesis protein)
MSDTEEVVLFLCGDVMTGRGIDQILPSPSAPEIHERYVTSALRYVDLAEAANGPVPRPVDFAYPWGEALDELSAAQPGARIINLETSVTRSADFEPKGINYRMHPGNVPCLSAAQIDCCVLANNHVLDWGSTGLAETLQTLADADIAVTGAGIGAAAAGRPAIIDLPGGARVVVFGMCVGSSGIPWHWAAREDRPGVNLVDELSASTAGAFTEQVASLRQPNDVVVASIHWGGNWGYDIPGDQIEFAHVLIDSGTVDIVHGHSSHHAKAIEIYRGKPVLYGCGDFIDDYEGITGHEQYRGDLKIMYLAKIAQTTGRLVQLRLVPFQMRNLQLKRPSQADMSWLRTMLDTQCRQFACSIEPLDQQSFKVQECR